MTACTDPHNRTKEAGFTLVELLVSLAIIALISLMAVTALRTGHRIWERTSAQVNTTDREVGVRRVLRRQIASLLPLQGRIGRSQEQLLIEGDNDALAFVAPLPAYFGRHGLYRIEYRLQNNQLIFARSVYQLPRDFETRFADMSHEVLLENIQNIRFSYLMQNSVQGDWIDSLKRMTDPPALVRLEIQEADNPDEWRTFLVARPRITSVY